MHSNGVQTCQFLGFAMAFH